MPSQRCSTGYSSSGCGDSSAKSQQPQGSPGVPVKLQVAKSTTFNDTTDYVATLKSRDSAVIMPQVEGQITQIYVHSGDRVSTGTPLMQIDPSKQQATVKSQEDLQASVYVGRAPAQVDEFLNDVLPPVLRQIETVAPTVAATEVTV